MGYQLEVSNCVTFSSFHARSKEFMWFTDVEIAFLEALEAAAHLNQWFPSRGDGLGAIHEVKVGRVEELLRLN